MPPSLLPPVASHVRIRASIRARLCCLAALADACSAGPPATRNEPKGQLPTLSLPGVLSELRRAAGCQAPVGDNRVWCKAARLEDSSGSLPAADVQTLGRHTWLGVEVDCTAPADLSDCLRRTRTLAMAVLEHGHLEMAPLWLPETQESDSSARALYEQVTQALLGERARVTMEGNQYHLYEGALSRGAAEPAGRGSSPPPVQLYKMDDVWVAIRPLHGRESGFTLCVLTDRIGLTYIDRFPP